MFGHPENIFEWCFGFFFNLTRTLLIFYIPNDKLFFFFLISISQTCERPQLQQAVVLVAVSFQIHLHVDHF